MSLRARIVVWSTVIFIAFFVLAGVLGSWFSIRNYERLEENDVHHEVDVALRALHGQMESLGTTVRDWASWDDAHRFMRTQSQDFVRANLEISTLVNLRLDVIAFVDSGATRVVFGRALDWRVNRLEQFPASLSEHLAPGRPLVRPRGPDEMVTGILDLPEGPLMVASAPIVSSDRQGASRGMLVMGRYLRHHELARLRRATGHDVELARPDVLDHKTSGSVTVVPIDAAHVAGDLVIGDLYARPAVLMRVIVPRTLYRQGLRDSQYLLGALFAAGLVFFVSVYFLVDRHVLRRLQSLNVQVQGLAPLTSLMPVSIPGKDEISALAKSINRLLAEVDVSRATMREGERRLRKLTRAVEQSPAGILITNLKGEIEFVNPRLEAITGYTFAELNGRNPRIFKSGINPSEIYREMWSALTAGREWRGEICNRRKDGTLYWELAIFSAIRDEQGVITHYLAVKQDISEQKGLKDELIQARRMESIGQLAGGVAHDFNNLLTVILGSVEDLRRALPEGAERKFVEEIATASQRAADLTRQLLTFGRRQVINPQVMDLNARYRSIEPVLRRVIREDIEITYCFASDLMSIRADSSQMQQVILNLAVNARDAMPLGGRLTIATENVILEEEATVRGITLRPGRYVMLTVEDTGCGMTDEIRERIFEPFFTTKGNDEGTGLGLATVFGIVEQSGGHIGVESAPGKGTTFVILLPGVLEKPLDAPKATPNRHIPANGEVILVADDEPGVLKVVKRLLERKGYHVLAATDGEEALAMAATAERLDLVITDVVMPRLGGLDLADRLKIARPGLPIIYISGHINRLDRAAGRFHEANFLTKPFTMASLLAAVQSALHSRRDHREADPKNSSSAIATSAATDIATDDEPILSHASVPE